MGYSYQFIKIEEFIHFLLLSQIKQLEIDLKDEDISLDTPLFYAYLQSTKILTKLLLDFNKVKGLKWNLILNSLALNSSIKVLQLESWELRSYYSDIVNLIRNNQSITSLNFPLSAFLLKIDFSEALVANKSLLYLRLECVRMDSDTAELLIKSNLKGIYLLGSNENDSIATMIYTKIPKYFPEEKDK